MGKGKDLRPRDVAVAIPFCQSESGEVRICLVSSRKHAGKLVLPKGGVEKGERGLEAALREMWEEAGLKSTEPSKAHEAIACVLDHKPHKHSPSSAADREGFVPRARYEAFAVRVREGSAASELDDWPEKDERTRTWMSFDDACAATAWRKDIHALLCQSKQYLQ